MKYLKLFEETEYWGSLIVKLNLFKYVKKC